MAQRKKGSRKKPKIAKKVKENKEVFIKKILISAQESLTKHSNLVKELFSTYSKRNEKINNSENNEEPDSDEQEISDILAPEVEFVYSGIDCKKLYTDIFPFIGSILLNTKKNIQIDRLLNFFASLIVFPSNHENKIEKQDEKNSEDKHQQNDQDEEAKNLLNIALSSLMTLSRSSKKQVRQKSCELICLILDLLNEETELDESLFESLKETLQERLIDRFAGIRAAAIKGIYRLQEPDLEEECTIVKLLSQICTHDESPTVRQLAVEKIAVTKETLKRIIERTRDENPGVRKSALNALMKKVKMKSLKISDRVNVLVQGAKDRDKDVGKAGQELLKTWIDENDFTEVDRCDSNDSNTNVGNIGEVERKENNRQREDKLIKFLEMLDVECNEEEVNEIIEKIVLSYPECVLQTISHYSLMCIYNAKGSEEIGKVNKLSFENSIQLKENEYSLLSLINNNFISNESSLLFRTIVKLPQSKSFLREMNFGSIDLKEVENYKKIQQSFNNLSLMETVRICKQIYGDFLSKRNESFSVVNDVSEKWKGKRNLNCFLTMLKNVLFAMYEAFEFFFSEEVSLKEARSFLNSLLNDNRVVQEDLVKSAVALMLKVFDSVQEGLEEISLIASESFSNSYSLPNESVEKGEGEEKGKRKTNEKLVLKSLSIFHNLLYYLYSYNSENLLSVNGDVPIHTLGQQVEEPEGCLSENLPASILEVFNTFVLPCIANENPFIRNAALKILGVLAIKDFKIAAKYLKLLKSVLENDQEALQLSVLKIIFDILFVHFVKMSGNEREENGVEKLGQFEIESGLKDSVIESVSEFLYSENSVLMAFAVEGFCKLLLSGILNDCKIFSTIALLYFNPTTSDNFYLRQICSIFFSLYIPFGERVNENKSIQEEGERKRRAGNSSQRRKELVYSALMPCIKSILNSPFDSPLQRVNLEEFSAFFLNSIALSNSESNDGNENKKDIDIEIEKEEKMGVKEGTDFSFHRNFFFDLVYEILAFPDKVENNKRLMDLLLKLNSPKLFDNVGNKSGVINVLKKLSKSLKSSLIDRKYIRFVDFVLKEFGESSEIESKSNFFDTLNLIGEKKKKLEISVVSSNKGNDVDEKKRKRIKK